MVRLLLKPLLSVIMLFAIVSIAGITFWIIKDLWWVILLCIAGVYLAANIMQKK